MLRNIIIVQCEVGRQLSLEENLLIFKRRPDFVLFPEYYNTDPDRPDIAHNAAKSGEHLLYCQTLSDRFNAVVIAGSGIAIDSGRFHNTSSVFAGGQIVGKYRKISPTANEVRKGISAGTELCLIEAAGVRISILICADVLHRENFVRMAAMKPDIVFIPATSPWRKNETIKEKFARDNSIFVSGAQIMGSYVVKGCAVGSLWGRQLQGRSLIAAPWGVLNRIAPDEEDRRRMLSATLDISELREFRQKQGLSIR